MRLKVVNDSALFHSAAQVCGPLPKALNARAHNWHVKAGVPVSLALNGQYCLQLAAVGPYQAKVIDLIWEPGAGAAADARLSVPQAEYFPSEAIERLALRLNRGSKKETLAATQTWLRENVAFSGIRRGVEGAEFALRHREGDCTEHMLLAAHLLKLNGIETRQVLGVRLAEGQMSVSAQSLHNWVEYQLDGRWHLFDSTRARGDAEGAYIAVAYLDAAASFERGLWAADSPALRIFLQ